MIRTQISFEEKQYAELLARARERGISMAAFVRDAVDDKLRTEGAERDRVKRRALSVIGIARGPGLPIGRDHDRYLDEAYGDW